jgi:hypothetical protein
MLLKCKYLAQFSLNELSKNASTISLAAKSCPFMMHAFRTISSSSSFSSNNSSDVAIGSEKDNTVPMQESETNFSTGSSSANAKLINKEKQIACTNTINCPFFKNGNIDLQKILIEKRLEESGETTTANSKQHFNVSTKRAASRRPN